MKHVMGDFMLRFVLEQLLLNWLVVFRLFCIYFISLFHSYLCLCVFSMYPIFFCLFVLLGGVLGGSFWVNGNCPSVRSVIY